MKYTCPVCGFDQLSEPPYDEDGNPSYEICDCCGFEYGFDDKSEGYLFEQYREEWIKKGANWFNPKSKPENWNLKKQLSKVKE